MLDFTCSHSIDFPESGEEHSPSSNEAEVFDAAVKIAIPVAAVVQYATFRIYCEPLISLPASAVCFATKSERLNDLLQNLEFVAKKIGLEVTIACAA